MSDFLLPALQALAPYVPGEQPQDRSYIKLNTNESPFPPSPRVLSALSCDEASRLNLYSDPQMRSLHAAIADAHRLRRECVFTGNGSDEVLALAFLAFSDAEHPVVMPDVSYGLYPIYARLFRAEPRIVPLNEDFTLPVEKFLHAGATVVFANPNAPTGIALPLSRVEEIVKANAHNVVIVDEAYADFAKENALELLERYDNLLIVRTFSKSRSLAGARLGYALGSAALISDLERVRNSFHPYSINRLSMLAGVEAMRDSDYFARCVGEIVREREESASELRALGFTLTNSQANFLLASHPERSGKELYEGLKARGVLVRYFDQPRLKPYVRITVGTREQMRTLMLMLREVLATRA